MKTYQDRKRQIQNLTPHDARLVLSAMAGLYPDAFDALIVVAKNGEED